MTENLNDICYFLIDSFDFDLFNIQSLFSSFELFLFFLVDYFDLKIHAIKGVKCSG